MTGHPHRLFAAFNGRQVEIHCGSDQLASQVRLRLNHLLAAPCPGASAALRLTLSEPTASCVELRDSAGRYEAGSLEHVLYVVRKWTTADFAAAHPHLLWLHAGAAAKDGAVVLLAGPAGAGKSTLVVRLLERGWRLFGDDVVPVDVNRQAALPLPFTPDVRTTPSADLDDQRAFVEQPKQVVAIPADRVAREPGPIGAIVFPAYDRDRDARPSLAPMSVVSAAEALAGAFAYPTSDTRGLVAGVFRLAQRIACYRLDYLDATAAAAALAQRTRVLKGPTRAVVTTSRSIVVDAREIAQSGRLGVTRAAYVCLCLVAGLPLISVLRAGDGLSAVAAGIAAVSIWSPGLGLLVVAGLLPLCTPLAEVMRPGLAGQDAASSCCCRSSSPSAAHSRCASLRSRARSGPPSRQAWRSLRAQRG